MSETKHELGLGFQPRPHPPGRREWTWGPVITNGQGWSPSCLHGGPPHKQRGSESFQADNCPRAWEGGHPERCVISMPLPPHLALCISPIWLFRSFVRYNSGPQPFCHQKPVSWRIVFPWSWGGGFRCGAMGRSRRGFTPSLSAPLLPCGLVPNGEQGPMLYNKSVIIGHVFP